MKNPYLKGATVSLHNELQYRANTVLRFISAFFISYATVAIWSAIMRYGAEKLDEASRINTIKYMIITSTFGFILWSIRSDNISNKVKTGDISRDLCYPVSIPLMILCNRIGNSLYNFLTRVVPAVIFLTLIFNVQWSLNPGKLCYFFFSFFAGYIIFFLFYLIVDMLSFWVYDTSLLKEIVNCSLFFLGGTYVPLWFYPKWLYNICDYLPFKNIFFIPIQLYLYHYRATEILRFLLVDLIWILILSALFHFLWKLGVRRLVIQGG